jgi:hypothetical protein
MIYEGEPGFLDPDGHYYLDGVYEEHEVYGPYRLVDEGLGFQADDTSLELARGRKIGDHPGASFDGFNLLDPDFVDLTSAASGKN